jgi:hypothetical protein
MAFIVFETLAQKADVTVRGGEIAIESDMVKND